MSELQFRSAKPGLGRSVRWEPEGDDGKSIYLGETIQGEYVGHEEDVGDNQSNIYRIRLEDGSSVSVWGTQILDDCFARGGENETEIPVGAIVRITHLGKKFGKSGPSKTKGYHTFNVEYAVPSPAFKAAQQAKSQGVASTAAPSAGARLAAAGQPANPEREADTESSTEDEY